MNIKEYIKLFIIALICYTIVFFIEIDDIMILNCNKDVSIKD